MLDGNRGGGVLELDSDELARNLNVLKSVLSEKDYRLVLGGLAQSAKRGGQSRMREMLGTSRGVIRAGSAELAALAAGGASLEDNRKRIRRPAAGRRPVDALYPNLEDSVEQTVPYNCFY